MGYRGDYELESRRNQDGYYRRLDEYEAMLEYNQWQAKLSKMSFDGVSADKPVYADVDLQHSRYPDISGPYWSGVVAISGGKDDRVGITFIEDGDFDRENNLDFKGPKIGDIVWVDRADISVNNIFDETASLRKKYDAVQKMHENTPYTISGCEYSDTPTYYAWDKNQEFPKYDMLPETKQTFTPPVSEVASLEDAEKWMIRNHPELYMGMSAHQDCPGGNFMVLAVPGAGNYPEGTYENRAARIAYAKSCEGNTGFAASYPEKAPAVADSVEDKRSSRVAALEDAFGSLSEGSDGDGYDFG